MTNSLFSLSQIGLDSAALIDPSKALMPRVEAINMVRNYKDFSADNTLQKTNYTWTPINELICFLTKMRTQYNADGCRFYFAAHRDGETYSSSGVHVDYSKKMTLVIVATKFDTITKLDEEIVVDIVLDCDTTTDRTAGMALDFGTLCPPHVRHKATTPGDSIHFDVYGK